MKSTGTIADVLAGNQSIKVDIGVDTTSAVTIGIVLFVVIVIAGALIKRI